MLRLTFAEGWGVDVICLVEVLGELLAEGQGALAAFAFHTELLQGLVIVLA